VVDKIRPFSTKSRKFKFSTTYFVGTVTIEIIGKLTGLKKNDVNNGENIHCRNILRFYCVS
jgi:hypothetical protein